MTTAHGGRRLFLRNASAGLVLAACAKSAERRTAAASKGGDEKEAEVTPGEDLMQEHGVLERILLIYEEAARRIEHGEALDVGVVARAASIVRRFVEDYHEKQEEELVFPRLESAHREVALVTTLRLQHERGRKLTDAILQRASAGPSTDLSRLLQSFGRMYRPHYAREDTVLFPTFRDVIGQNGYGELGEQFEANEHRLFGKGGFEKVVSEVATLEQVLGIYDLASFTPPL
jgi:hemerythrin-like domain-containing protein